MSLRVGPWSCTRGRVAALQHRKQAKRRSAMKLVDGHDVGIHYKLIRETVIDLSTHSKFDRDVVRIIFVTVGASQRSERSRCSYLDK